MIYFSFTIVVVTCCASATQVPATWFYFPNTFIVILVLQVVRSWWLEIDKRDWQNFIYTLLHNLFTQLMGRLNTHTKTVQGGPVSAPAWHRTDARSWPGKPWTSVCVCVFTPALLSFPAGIAPVSIIPSYSAETDWETQQLCKSSPKSFTHPSKYGSHCFFYIYYTACVIVFRISPCCFLFLSM